MEVQVVRRLVQYISVASNSFTFVTSRLQFTADYITGSRRGRAPLFVSFIHLVLYVISLTTIYK